MKRIGLAVFFTCVVAFLGCGGEKKPAPEPVRTPPATGEVLMGPDGKPLPGPDGKVPEAPAGAKPAGDATKK